MKRFLTISALLISFWASALACGPWMRPQYYVFSVYNRVQASSDARLAPMYNFWRQYVGEDISSWKVDQLSSIGEAEFSTTDNPIILYARQHGDTEMLEYLRQLTTYHNYTCESDTWDYPTRSQLDARARVLKDISLRAVNYHGQRLSGQYALLHVRCLVQLGEAQAVADYWNSRGKNLPQSVYKDMARGLYAWSLLALGQKRKALTEYADMGDMASIAWLAKDERNLKGIMTEYDIDPNSPLLIYLVQDFVNTTPDNAEQQRQYYRYSPEPEVLAQYQNRIAQMQKFRDFALQVVKKGKTSSPSMWQAAAGLISYRLGNTDDAKKLLKEAIKMKGSQRMKDNARLCQLVVSSGEADSSDKFQDYLLSELQWLQSAIENENKHLIANNNLYEGNHYLEVATNLIYDKLTPLYLRQGNSNLAGALCGMLHNFSRKIEGISDNDIYPSYDYYNFIDTISSSQAIAYAQFLKSGGDSRLEKWLVSQNAHIDNTYFIDRIGTKLMREGKFQEAIRYVSQVPVSFMAEQGISRYMARRDYNVERWFRRQVVDHWDDYSSQDSPQNVKLTSNQKLLFCNDVVRLENAVAQNPTDDISLYQLANLYFQASYKGDCWYLTRYASSVYDTICYPDEKDFMAESIKILKQAKSCTRNEKLRQKCIYALAFIPYGEPYLTYTWDESYNQIAHYNTRSYYYKAMSELAGYYKMRNGNVEPFISKCDNLFHFMASK